MAYGTTKVDTIQSSTAATAPVFKDGNGTQIGTLCRAWVNFNGTGTVAIRSSFNVSSITDNGTGDYTINFTNALPDVNYAVFNTPGSGGAGGGLAASNYYSNTNTTTSCRCLSYVTSTAAASDAAMFSVAVFR